MRREVVWLQQSEDPLDPAIGLVNGLAVSLVVWGVVGLAIVAPQAAGVVVLAIVTVVALMAAPLKWWRL